MLLDKGNPWICTDQVILFDLQDMVFSEGIQKLILPVHIYKESIYATLKFISKHIICLVLINFVDTHYNSFNNVYQCL